MTEILQIWNIDKPELQTIIDSIDTDGDGVIDYSEFIAAAYNREILLSQQNLKVAFNMFDQDGNGQITLEELKSIFNRGQVSERSDDVWEKMLAEVDENGDNEISFDEFKNAMTKILRMRATFLGDKII